MYDHKEHILSGVLSPYQDNIYAPADLSVPHGQWLLERSFPLAPNQATFELSQSQKDIKFSSSPAQRWDLAGWDNSGLYMNGLWHPQPEEISSWEVSVEIPEGWWIVLNGEIAQSTIKWHGQTTTHDLSILQKAYTLTTQEHTLIGPKPLHTKAERLTACLSPKHPPTTVVVAPMHHRLVHAGNHQIWLSEHALEGDLGLWKAHCDAINRAFFTLHSTANTIWSKTLDAHLKYPTSSKMFEQLSTIKWLPEVDYILHSGRLPFHSDIFSRPPIYKVPTWNALSQSTYPPSQISLQLEERLTNEAYNRLREDTSIPLEIRLKSVGITETQLNMWMSPPPLQNYSILKDNSHLWLVREADEDAPSETVSVDLDGRIEFYTFPEGSGRHQLPPSNTIKIDPNQSIPQQTYTDDKHPRGWSYTASLMPYSINTDTWRPSVVGRFGVRPHPTHPLRMISALSTSPTTLVGIDQYLMYGWGQALDNRARPFNSWISAGLQLPEKGESAVRSIELGSSVDTRSTWLYPRTGYGSSVSLGKAISSSQSWLYGRITLTGLKQISGRFVGVQRLHYAQTGSQEWSTQYPIGGLSGVASQSTEIHRGKWRFISNTEIRYLALRDLNIHLPFIRWTDLIVHLGSDIGFIDRPSPYQAHGLALGVSVSGDVLDVRPGYLGFSMGIDGKSVPQFYLHATHRL